MFNKISKSIRDTIMKNEKNQQSKRARNNLEYSREDYYDESGDNDDGDTIDFTWSKVLSISH